MDTRAKVELGERVTAARRRRKLTQQELAAEAGVSLGTISGLERGETLPQRANRAVIARALGEDVFGEAKGDELRYTWPNDVQVFADTLGQYLSQLEPKDRATLVAKWMREILNRTD